MTALIGGVAVLGLTPPAWAAPGDAAGTALRVGLVAAAGNPVGLVLGATATVASVDAPPDDSATGVDVAAALTGATGVTATSGTASADASSDATGSAGSSSVQDLALAVLGSPTSATVLSGSADCPAGGPPVADTVVTDLQVLGQTIVVGVGQVAVDVQAAVTVDGLVDATVRATGLAGVEQVVGDTATARALQVDVVLTGTAGNAQVTIPLGQIVAGEASCTSLAAAPPAVVPVLTGLTPDAGPTTGGQTVTVTGSGFVPAATTVTIGGVPVPAGQVTVTSPTSLTFATPAQAAGPVQVTVETTGGTSAPLPYTYVAAPTTASLIPDTGPTPGGTQVTVTGTDFVPGATSVTIGGTVVPVERVSVTSPTTLTFATPAHPAGPVDVVVSTPGGAAAPLAFTYTPVTPTSAGLDPSAGPTAGGTTVTLTGSGFVAGSTTVTIGGTTVQAPGVTVTSPTTLTFRTPPGTAGSVPVTATTDGGTTAPLPFRYVAPPVAGQLTPDSGPTTGGTSVTVTGSGFVPGATTVTIGGVVVPADQVTVTGPTTLTFVTPAHAAGTVGVTVSTEGGSTAELPFRYGPAPTGSLGSGTSTGNGVMLSSGNGAGSGGRLAQTGADLGLPALGGAAALLAGFAMTMGARRRSRG